MQQSSFIEALIAGMQIFQHQIISNRMQHIQKRTIFLLILVAKVLLSKLCSDDGVGTLSFETLSPQSHLVRKLIF